MKILFGIWVTLAVASAYGYIANIINLVNMDVIFDTSVGIISFVGIFIPPVGVVMGYIG